MKPPANPLGHPRFDLLVGVIDVLLKAADTVADRTTTAVIKARRKHVGATLRPGSTTPLWNELAAHIRPLLARRGEQVKLARVLGVPRQTVNMWLTSKSRMPDAERTLQLIAWLVAMREGKPPS